MLVIYLSGQQEPGGRKIGIFRYQLVHGGHIYLMQAGLQKDVCDDCVCDHSPNVVNFIIWLFDH